MKVTQEKLPASQIGLEIEITPEMSKQAYEKTLQEFTRSANIPGFRKGKVPRQVLIQRFGPTRIKAAVVEDLIESSLKQAVEQEKIEAIGNFELRSPFEQLVNQFEPGSSLTFAAAVDVPPELKLDQYTGFEVKAENIEYQPAKVDEVLEDYRNRTATLVPVEGRSAQRGDVAEVDFTGRVVNDDEAAEPEEIPGGSATDFEIELVEGKFIEGFVDGIIGMTPGETKEVSVTFPEGYPQESLSGKPAVFTITLKELKQKELPELDDDFAQDVSEFETIAELRESLESRYQKEAQEKTRANKEQALLEELAKHIEVDLPETLIKREVDYMLTQTAMRLSNQGMDIKQLFTTEIVQQLRERSRPEAITRLQRTLALGEIAKRESIKAEKSEIDAKVEEYLKDYPGQDVDIDRLRQVVEEDLVKEKIFDWLEQNSTIELVPEGSLAPSPAPDAAEAEAEDDAPSETTAATATVDVSSETVDEAIADPVADAKPSSEPTEAADDSAADAPKKGSKTTKKSKSKTADTEQDTSSQSESSEDA